jgi:hypothetical protein
MERTGWRAKPPTALRPPLPPRRAMQRRPRSASARWSSQRLGLRFPLRQKAKRGLQRGAAHLPLGTAPSHDLPDSSPSVFRPGGPPVSPRNRKWPRSACAARPSGQPRFARVSILTLPASSAVKRRRGGCWRPLMPVPRETHWLSRRTPTKRASLGATDKRRPRARQLTKCQPSASCFSSSCKVR